MGPKDSLMFVKATSMSSSDSLYSPTTQRAMRSTEALVISPIASSRRRVIACLCSGYVITTSATKLMTSRAEATFVSPRCSMRAWTTLQATSGKRRAQEWMALMRMRRYSGPCSASSDCVFVISFLRRETTSSMLRGFTRSIANSSVFLRMSSVGQTSARSTSISSSCSTLPCFFFTSVSLSRMISFTLLSLSSTRSWMKVEAAALVAIGDWESARSAQAASYCTECACSLSRERMQRM
mmetsp:Transcript_18513/g.71477  ORF Transcript_18513/g.71477 Transcript_18513/m.71477 type:complete len:239 (-) Transcript_18513:866-1582(-)